MKNKSQLQKKKSKRKNSEKSSFYEALQLTALQGKVLNTPDFFERKVRRWYSSSFNTPLEKTHELPWSFILLNYYEDQVDKLEYNDAFDRLVDYLPKVQKLEDEENQQFADDLIEEQQKTLKKKKPNNLKQLGDNVVEKLNKTKGKLNEISQSLNQGIQEVNLNFEDTDE